MSGPKSVKVSVPRPALSPAERAAIRRWEQRRRAERAAERAEQAAERAGWAAERATRRIADRARRTAERARQRDAERARRQSLQQRAQTLSAQLGQLAEQWQAARREHGDVIAEWPYEEVARDLSKYESDSSLENDDLKAALDDLAVSVVQAQGDHARQMAVSKMRVSLEAASQSQAAEALATARAAKEEEAKRNEREMRRCADEVVGLLKMLAAEVPQDTRTAIEKRADETIGSSLASRRNALLSQLRLEIQRANDAAEARRRMALRMAVQAEQWREQLAGLEGAEVTELDRHLQQVVNGEVPAPDLAQRVEQVVARATEESDRNYALSVITEELTDLGYVVEGGFETAWAQNSEVLLHKPDMEEDYHVSLRAEGSLLHNRVVREAGDDDVGGRSPRGEDHRRADTEMEQIWCNDLATALAAARHRGVQGQVVSRRKPGEVPVKTIAALNGGSTAKSKAKRKRSKRRRKRTGRLKARAGR